MSLPVWPLAFIRRAVAMCSVSSTLRGRPNFFAVLPGGFTLERGPLLDQLALDSAIDASMPITMRPVAVDESIPSVVDTKVTPRSVSFLTVSRMCNLTVSRMCKVLLPNRSSFQTTTRRPPARSQAVWPGLGGRPERRTSRRRRLVNPRGFERRVLLIKCLSNTADTCVADASTVVLRMSGRVSIVFHKY